MEHPFSRTELLLGDAAIEVLKNAHIAIFGLGGVGSYAVEVLARSGVGALDLFDDDCVCASNINRQLYALHSTVGKPKVEVAKQRVQDINPQCAVNTYRMFYLPENADDIDLSQYHYVVDCIDTVTAKIELIRRCHRLQVPIICSMGAANKLDSTAFKVADIYKTGIDPLAKVIRKRLRKEGIPRLKCVFSEEKPLCPIESIDTSATEYTSIAEENDSSRGKKRIIPASVAFVPAAAGLIIGGEVVLDLLRKAGVLRSNSQKEYNESLT